MRRSEVLGLKWEDVDLDTGSLKIRRGLQRVDGGLVEMPTKTERSRRTVPLPAFVTEMLRLQAEQQDKWRANSTGAFAELDYVFTTPIGTPIDPRNCTRIVQNACTRAGVRVVRLHDFRHGCVSVLLDLGVPPRTAMEIVGHTTIEMTMNVYGHVSLESMRSAMDQLGDLFGTESEPEVTSESDVSRRPGSAAAARRDSPKCTKPQVSGCAACGSDLRARRDSNPKPSDP